MRQLNFFLSLSSSSLAPVPVPGPLDQLEAKQQLFSSVACSVYSWAYKATSIPALLAYLPPLLVTMGDMANEIKLLSGNSHPVLAKLVADW